MGVVLDLLFPRRCAACGAGPWPFCDHCRAELVVLAPPWCARCGAPSLSPVADCGDCPPPPLASARAPFRFEGPARRAVHRLKFGGRRDVAEALAGAVAALGPPPPVDVVTWVPLTRSRLAERGFDQARAIATPLGRRLGIPVAGLLRRPAARGDRGSRSSQARRRSSERRTAVLGAFEAVRSSPARVALVDDVLTTGATAAACAEALHAAGAQQVHLVAAARAVRPLGRPLGRPPGPALRPAALRVPGTAAYPREGSRPGLWLPGDHPR